jgi:hypothetical protein
MAGSAEAPASSSTWKKSMALQHITSFHPILHMKMQPKTRSRQFLQAAIRVEHTPTHTPHTLSSSLINAMADANK